MAPTPRPEASLTGASHRPPTAAPISSAAPIANAALTASATRTAAVAVCLAGFLLPVAAPPGATAVVAAPSAAAENPGTLLLQPFPPGMKRTVHSERQIEVTVEERGTKVIRTERKDTVTRRETFLEWSHARPSLMRVAVERERRVRAPAPRTLISTYAGELRLPPAQDRRLRMDPVAVGAARALLEREYGLYSSPFGYLDSAAVIGRLQGQRPSRTGNFFVPPDVLRGLLRDLPAEAAGFLPEDGLPLVRRGTVRRSGRMCIRLELRVRLAGSDRKQRMTGSVQAGYEIDLAAGVVCATDLFLELELLRRFGRVRRVLIHGRKHSLYEYGGRR